MPSLLKTITLSLAFGLTTAAQATDIVTLKIAHFLPSASNVHTNVIEPWCKTLASESQGRLQCQLYPSLQLGGTAAQLADQARNGIADIVWTAPGYSPGRFPKTEAIELPGMLPLGGVAGSKVVWAFYQQNLQDEYSHYKVLAMHADGGMNLHTRQTNIQSLADFQGLKLRAPNRVISAVLTELGAVPVAMPPAQVTEAISKGVVDGASAVWENVVPTKIDEVTQFHIDTPANRPALGATVIAMLMNPRKYQALPDDLRAIIDRNSGDALVQRFGEAWDSEIAKAKTKVTANGGSITVLSDDAYDAISQALKPVEQRWIADAKGFDAQALVDAAHALYPQP